ncbi:MULTISPECIES: nucleoside-diphosphate sugar epimerase/dehydratase [Anaerostipes]|uniref:Nucleoside-diphosphate sugar epimerase/dehydratase n=2 Tax=Anaerostipes TaxID=207244 RepID=A0ABV4DBU1_9FIRM|nr:MULTISPECIES: nucleoside-diphosphate sugar epimerase/dehydratase [Anaerostipes]MBC5676482.1 polysaccharide biosynthesis protein [Anaerostipes hominis (ex Liu et al. 2021)]
MIFKTISIRRMGLFIFDIIAVILAAYGALWVRFNGQIEPYYLSLINKYIYIILSLTMFIFILLKFYTSLWLYASIYEFRNIIMANIISSASNMIMFVLFEERMFRSWYFIFALILTALTGGIRFFYRFIRLYLQERGLFGRSRKDASRIMIIGAGEAGNQIAKEITGSDKLNKTVVCFIDDMETKQGRYLQGKKVVGKREKILEASEKYEIDEIYIAIPSATGLERKKIIDICSKTKCKIKVLPGMYKILNDEVSVSALRNIEIEDLLGRDQIEINTEEIMDYVNNKVVMVTGGGGSIGSELCRQIAKHGPKQLILIDFYENNAYDIQQELIRKYPTINIKVLIASVRNSKKIDKIFKEYHPDIIYHAAAHKHVPLMEDSPNEAVKNNVFGTFHVAKAADKYEAKKFILISTDKAVNPTNIMGATKRICEMIVQAFGCKSKTEFVAVRFGNVLGSNGSVIPLFKKQIEEGGPVTVTHPDIIRYFMTIPEAVSLVLQAGAYAKGGEIFVLDMGEPVKILDLATNLIKFSGYTPNVDIKIEFTGLRPGEKLFEELLMEEEGLKTTPNKLIKIGKPIVIDEKKLSNSLKKLYEAAYAETENMKELVHDLVDTYHYRKE